MFADDLPATVRQAGAAQASVMGRKRISHGNQAERQLFMLWRVKADCLLAADAVEKVGLEMVVTP
jgi:hypothetical protein